MRLRDLVSRETVTHTHLKLKIVFDFQPVPVIASSNVFKALDYYSEIGGILGFEHRNRVDR